MEGANPYPCFEDEETKAHRGEEMDQKPHDSEVELGFDLQHAVSRACALYHQLTLLLEFTNSSLFSHISPSLLPSPLWGYRSPSGPLTDTYQHGMMSESRVPQSTKVYKCQFIARLWLPPPVACPEEECWSCCFCSSRKEETFSETWASHETQNHHLNLAHSGSARR